MIGHTISHYRILEKLGEGGMGVVYKAIDLDLDRPVAIKFLPPDLSRDADSKARFINEAKVASKLQHENICTIHEIGQTEEGDRAARQLFIVMDYYEGTTLKAVLAARGGQSSGMPLGTVAPSSPARLPLVEAIDIVIQAARGIQAAHDNGIIHRDIKPSNIIITRDGKVKVLDFGLARSVEHSGVTKTGQTPGTLAYMSPEQATGGRVDYRTDIWSLGVLIYEMVAGERPFEAVIGPVLVYLITKKRPQRLWEIRKDIPDALDRIVRKALEKNPEKRYQRVEEIIADLQSLRGGGIGAATLRTKMVNTLRRNTVLSSGLVAAALTLAVVMSLLFFRRSHHETFDSIAFLPLQNLSSNPEQEYFADGMTEAIIGELEKIGSLGVSSRTSIMRYKNTEKSLPEIAHELKAKAIADGSVLLEGNTVRFNVKLIEPSTGTQIWAGSFEGEMQNIVALQCEISRSIAHESGVSLSPREEMQLSGRARVSPEAYDAYLRGRHYRFMETVESLPKALSFCQIAVEKDSNFAPGWSELSQAWIFLDWTIGVFPKYHAQSRMAVNKALALDSTISEAYVALALVQIFYEFNWADGEKSLKRAIQLNRNDWNARREYGLLLLRTGRTAEAIVQFQKPQESDPLSGACMRELGLAYLLAGHHSLAIDCLEKAVREKSLLRWSMQDFYNSPRDHLVWEYLREDSVEKARELCRLTNPDLEVFVDAIRADRQHSMKNEARLKRLLDDPLTRCFYLARVYWRWGEHDRAIAQVEQGCRIQPAWTMVIPTDPYLREIRSDPRFTALLEQVGLHQ